MKIISFDIGIKNMAYCIISNTNDNKNPIIIHDWNVINLIQDENTITSNCSCIIPPKTKKGNSKICGKKAKYMKNNEYFCEKHAKSNKNWLMPDKSKSISKLNKLKVNDIIALCNSHLLLLNRNENLKKAEMIKILDNFYKDKSLIPIVNKKTSANTVDLIQIGKSIKQVFNNIEHNNEITHVIIENQISPIANRMKTIQGMLAQYFIMINHNIHIEFVSSSHKLKQFGNNNDTKNNNKENKVNPDYKQHKKDGITYSNLILDNNHFLNNWKGSLNTNKKDDLADSLLQGLWFLKHSNIIYYAEDLEIKLV